MFLALAAAAALAAAQPAAESAGANASASGALKPGEKRMKVVCRTEVTTGTRFGKRVCLPLDEFKRRQEQSQEGFAEMQRNHNVTPTKGN